MHRSFWDWERLLVTSFWSVPREFYFTKLVGRWILWAFFFIWILALIAFKGKTTKGSLHHSPCFLPDRKFVLFKYFNLWQKFTTSNPGPHCWYDCDLYDCLTTSWILRVRKQFPTDDGYKIIWKMRPHWDLNQNINIAIYHLIRYTTRLLDKFVKSYFFKCFFLNLRY